MAHTSVPNCICFDGSPASNPPHTTPLNLQTSSSSPTLPLKLNETGWYHWLLNISNNKPNSSLFLSSSSSVHLLSSFSHLVLRCLLCFGSSIGFLTTSPQPVTILHFPVCICNTRILPPAHLFLPVPSLSPLSLSLALLFSLPSTPPPPFLPLCTCLFLVESSRTTVPCGDLQLLPTPQSLQHFSPRNTVEESTSPTYHPSKQSWLDWSYPE